MDVKFDGSFGRQLNQLASAFRQWGEDAEREATKAHRKIGNRWQGGAVARVPVDESTLKQRIITNTYHDQAADEIVTEVGTNVPYGKWLEFGTKRIAGGQVLALGEGEDITDAQAVKDWPAKSGESIDGMRDRSGRFVSGAKEQMPWLRPAFNAIREWAIDLLERAFRPPKQ